MHDPSSSLSDAFLILKQRADKGEIILEPPSSEDLISEFERILKYTLPEEIGLFYRFCNGFYISDDMFRFIPLDDMMSQGDIKGEGDFAFAEVMMYSDVWRISMNVDGYQVYNLSDVSTVLTESFEEFLYRVILARDTHSDLVAWQDEVEGKR